MGDQVERAIAVAMTKLGAPYVWATAGPETFDCSGFTWWVACQVLGPQDYELRSSHHQLNVWGDEGRDGKTAARRRHDGEMGRGDLVFFDTMGVVVMGNRASHVGMMIDEERFIHAANEELGVRIDALRGGWYEGKRIGSGRIFVEGDGVITRSARGDRVTGGNEHDPPISPCALPRGPLPNHPTTLVVPAGPIRTEMPWSGLPPGAEWSNIGRWAGELEDAAGKHHLNPRLPAAVMALETQGIHARDGAVIEVWDGHTADGPSVGLMQVKPWVWQYLVPAADAYEPAGNIGFGVAVLAHLIERYGSWQRAIAEGYHPGVSPNGTTPARYIEAMRGLLGELGYAA